MFDNIKFLFFLFIIYSIIGWCVEVVNSLIREKKFVNRGFLIGPYCPIYGLGCVLLTIIFQNNSNDFVSLFLKSIFICSILEYFTSYIMEKIFNYRWWDYSNRKFNINGRICLETMIPFGLGACLIIKYLNPILYKIYSSMSLMFGNILLVILFVGIIYDFIVSCVFVTKMKGIEKNTKIDSTEQLSIKTKEIINKNIIFYKRIFDSFPNLKIIHKNK